MPRTCSKNHAYSQLIYHLHNPYSRPSIYLNRYPHWSIGGFKNGFSREGGRDLFSQAGKTLQACFLYERNFFYQNATVFPPPPPSLPLDGMLAHHMVTHQQQIHPYPFIHLGGERLCESKVSCPRTQHNVPGQGSNLDCSIRG